MIHLELLSISDWPQYGGHSHAKFPLDLVEEFERAERRPVHLVDEREDGKFPQLAHLKERPHYPALRKIQVVASVKLTINSITQSVEYSAVS